MVALRLRGAAGFQASLPFASIAARRRANSSSETCSEIERLGMSIAMTSPLPTRPIAPPSAASGEIWPIEGPDEPPEKRPLVTSAQAFPGPFDFS